MPYIVNETKVDLSFLLQPKRIEQEMKEIKELALIHSDDPDTQVGCSLYNHVMGDLRCITGFNRFPKGVEITEERKQRPAKYQWICHAEVDAMTRAACAGIPLKGGVMFLPWFPCVDCAKMVIQAEIQTLVCYKPDVDNPKWGEEFKVAIQMLSESGTEVLFV